MSYSALFNSGFRHVEYAEESKNDRYQHPPPSSANLSRSPSASTRASQRRKAVPLQGTPIAPGPANHHHHLHVPRKPFADTQSVRSMGSAHDDVMSVKSWHPSSSSNPSNRVPPSRKPIPASAMLSPNQTFPPPRHRAPSAPANPAWQHTRQEKRRSFSFLYMSEDAPLDTAEEEEEEEEKSDKNAHQPVYSYAQSIPPPPPTPTVTRPRRQSYASTTAAKRPPPERYQEPLSSSTPSEQKRKTNVFSRLFHRKAK